DRRTNAIRHLEERRVRYTLRKFFQFEGGYDGAVRNLGHGALPGKVEVCRVFNFEPFLAPIGLNGSGGSGHEVSPGTLFFGVCMPRQRPIWDQAHEAIALRNAI